MKENKIKSLLALHNSNSTDLANHLKKSKQHISNKMKSEIWSVDEFIEIASLTNSKLAFIDENNKPIIIFDESDLKPKE